MDWLKCYHGKRILLTGNTGFKGVWLSAMLKALNAGVSGLSRQPDSVLHRDAGFQGCTQHIDVADGVAVLSAVTTTKPDIIFHLAAQPLVRLSHDQPVDTFMTNTVGTLNVLEAARQVDSVQAIIVITTDKVYRNTGLDRPFLESDPLGGTDPYSASKAMAEMVVETYRRSYFDDGPFVATARAGNVIGGGDWAKDRLVPDFVRAVSAGEPIKLRNPHHVRPWQHVLEPLRGYLMLGALLLKRPADDRVTGTEFGWNFGPRLEDAISVGDLAQQLIQLWGQGSVINAPEPEAPKEAPFLSLDSSKAREGLNWTPELDLDTSLAWTVDWYRRHHSGKESAKDLVEEQVRAYLDAVSRPS